MLKKFGEVINYISSYFFPEEVQVEARGEENFYKIVEQARQEWQDAKSRFNYVSDPDLIDHAVYAVDAAERRYMFLLKKAREEGVILQQLYQDPS